MNRTPITSPLLLVGRDATETWHGSEDEYREVGLSNLIFRIAPGSRANQKLSDGLPLALKFRPKKLQLDRMDRELKGGAVEEVAARA
jgi:hypothetical protein